MSRTKSFVIIFSTIVIGIIVFMFGITATIKWNDTPIKQTYSPGQMVICETLSGTDMYQVVKDTGRFIITSDDGIYSKADCELAWRRNEVAPILN